MLRECLTRVADDPDVVRQLLNVGLRLTDMSTIIQLNAGNEAVKKTAEKVPPQKLEVSQYAFCFRNLSAIGCVDQSGGSFGCLID